ncbi:MAG: hypothetical protein QNJ94_18070 [Alphaproteobacteria bacterium]|nr:hypothetical protein [Alphaproteobacteria bacterium]
MSDRRHRHAAGVAGWRQLLVPIAAAWLAAIIAGPAHGQGIEAKTVKQHALAQVGRLESELKRGVSTKADVLRLLGEPNGAGEFGGFRGARGPAHAAKGPADAWYYEASKAETGMGISEDLRVLLVFFMDERYDGFYWFTIKASGSWQ